MADYKNFQVKKSQRNLYKSLVNCDPNIVKILPNFTCWIRIRIPNADPGGDLNAYPDPKHWSTVWRKQRRKPQVYRVHDVIVYVFFVMVIESLYLNVYTYFHSTQKTDSGLKIRAQVIQYFRGASYTAELNRKQENATAVQCIASYTTETYF